MLAAFGSCRWDKGILALFSFLNETSIAKKNEYLIIFFDNAITTTTVSLALGVGVSGVLILFYDQSLTITRGAKGKPSKSK